MNPTFRAAFVAVALVQAYAAFAQNPPAPLTRDPANDQPVELSPFTVSAGSDEGYRATSTLAGTRIRTNLRDIGSAVSVVTTQFFTDTGVTDAKSLLSYTANTETGGPGGNISGAVLGNNYTDFELTRYRPQTNTRVRGLAAADLTRDLFLTDIPFDTYNTSRVDIQRGPNSILFGLGSPAGIINNGMNPASFQNSYKVSFRADDVGSARTTVSLNQALLPQELALHVDLLYSDTKYEQKPAFENDHRVFVAGRYEPHWLKFPSARTSVRANWEYGDVQANRPRPNPLGDQITPWFDPNGLNKATFDPATVTANRTAYPILGTPPRIGSNLVAIWSDPANPVQGGNGVPAYMLLSRNTGLNTGLPALGWSAIASRGSGATVATAWGAKQYGAFYKDQQLLDPSVFDFYHKLIDGPNKHEWQRFTAGNIAVEQTFFNGDAGAEVVYDRQQFYSAAIAAITGFRDGQALTIDLNTTLLDGTPNPNLGRPYISADSLDNASDRNIREAFRTTLFAQFDAKKHLGETVLARVLGKHVFTGLYNTQEVRKNFRKWRGYTTDGQYASIIRNFDQNSDSRLVANLHYLGGSLLNAKTLSGANLPNLTAVEEPRAGLNALYWNPTLNNGAGGFQTAAVNILTRDADKETLYSPSSTRTQDEIESKALVWQAHLWDGIIVPTVGFRKDTAKNFNAGPPPRNPVTQGADVYNPNWKLPVNPNSTVSGNSTSWSIVGHSPKFLNEHLPLGATFDLFYNKSDNFQAAAGRTDIYGRNQPAPAGKTTDYGFLITLFDDKLYLKVNHYETSLQNDAIAVVNAFFPGATEGLAWDATSRAYNIATHPAAVAAYLAALPSAEFQKAWVFSQTPNGSDGFNTFNNRPGGITQLADTVSKGLEFELTYNATSSWRIIFNASKQEAVRSNIANDLDQWIADRSKVWLGAAGDLELFGPATQNLRDYATANLLIPYQTAKNQNGGPAQEVRRWRWNFISTYEFKTGSLKGFSVGGAIRWQDKIAIGFPVTTINGVAQFDVNHPYYGSTETNVDLWVGYQRKLTRRIGWQVQLNVRNVNVGDKLIPIYAQPDGTIGAARIAESRRFQLTNTFSF